MRTIGTTIEVDDEGKATLRLPTGTKAGACRAVLVIGDPKPAATTHPTLADLPRRDIPWPFPEGYTFRREEMYDDGGRGA